ncbi:Sodium/calcium exchanger protein-domain-containing protein [Lophiotrema nucula]|uniref:Sodium/calcium exchanger protein-domain-containing protein n=1 Tax=Lophiotrema nucula TaxID=690887 RepID=A0A6A5ZT84_9PLEO|nr:Sodium/calcium exchanger protein-domain-containing protein [Lophiotrema nucula]
MHAIRRQAHRAASHVDQGSTNFNPFARTTSREMSGDVERGTPSRSRSTRSENNMQTFREKDRRLESREAAQEFPGPNKHDTEPASPTSAGAAEKHPIENGNSQSSKESADISDNTAVSEDKEKTGLKKRWNGIKNVYRKDQHDEENAPIEHVETEGLDREERVRRAHKRKIPVGQQFKTVVFSSWINVLLIFVPVGFAVNYAHIKSPVVIFILNFIAIIPLAGMLSYATEELAIRVGETFGGLLNATFGNAVELIVSIQALIKNEITIVKTSLIGSMLSNLLLVLGMSFFLGGVNRVEQHFNVTVAQTAASLLALCVASLIIPTVFHITLADDAAPDGQRNQELSRGTAVILLVVYGCYLFFQLKSHVDMYNAPSQKTPKNKSKKVEEGVVSRGLASVGAGTAAATGGVINNQTKLIKNQQEMDDDEEDEIEVPQLSVVGALVTLGLSTTMVAFCSEFMVSSIDGLTATGGVSTTFVGLILLPIVGNAAEHATAVTVAIKDKMDLAIGVAVGSSMQIALLVLPLTVILGWILGKDCMTLYFDTFQIATLFVSVLLVNYLIQDGKSHWLEGVLLMASYIIIAVAGWFYPNLNEESC